MTDRKRVFCKDCKWYNIADLCLFAILSLATHILKIHTDIVKLQTPTATALTTNRRRVKDD
jgi:hypothetical protein